MICERCEAALEVAPCTLEHHAVIDPSKEPGARLKLSSTPLQSDGRSPAADVLVYLGHTNARGLYKGCTGSTWAHRHHPEPRHHRMGKANDLCPWGLADQHTHWAADCAQSE